MARPRKPKATPSVSLAYIHPGRVHEGFTASLLAVAERTPFASKHAASSPRPTTSRNLVIEDFLNTSHTWLFMVDTDMTFPEDTVERLLATATKRGSGGPIAVSAVNYAYDANTAELAPVLMFYNDTADRYVGSRLYPDDGKPFRIDATGPACMLIHRQILEDIRGLDETGPSYWFYDQAKDDWFTGNDIVFCDRLRRAGHQIWVDPTLTTGHIKEIAFDRTLYLAQRAAHFGF